MVNLKMDKQKVISLAAEFIEPFEGVRLRSYKDSGGVWTIGIGAVGPGIKEGTVWTERQVIERFKEDLDERYEQMIRLLSDSPTTDNQGAAMLSLLFNIGSGNFKSSTVLREHRLKKYDRAANAFLMWNKAGGVVIGGLVRRRQAEKQLYLSDEV